MYIVWNEEIFERVDPSHLCLLLDLTSHVVQHCLWVAHCAETHRCRRLTERWVCYKLGLLVSRYICEAVNIIRIRA